MVRERLGTTEVLEPWKFETRGIWEGLGRGSFGCAEVLGVEDLEVGVLW